MVLLDNRTFDTMPLIIETLKRKDPVVETDRKTLNLEESKKVESTDHMFREYLDFRETFFYPQTKVY